LTITSQINSVLKNMRTLTILLCALCCFTTTAQTSTKRAFFVGNSYTAWYSLPETLRVLARTTGDTLYYDSNLVGGYSLQEHFAHETTRQKIMQGNWDYVVLQEQSQRPSNPIAMVESQVFPYAKKLDSLIKAHNRCAKTVLYMTWGRKNGDATRCADWPVVCTYMGMDSLTRLRYQMLADTLKADVSPVGAVWRYIREHYPHIELFHTDESHPTPSGIYAAACAFYATIYRKDPLMITHNYYLTALHAQQMRMAASVVVYNQLNYWKIGMYDEPCDHKVTTAELSYNEHKFSFSKFSDHLKLNIPDNEQIRYRILDPSGKTVACGENPYQGEIPINKLPCGIYLLMIASDKKTPFLTKFTR
jgi:hypothetical protein